MGFGGNRDAAAQLARALPWAMLARVRATADADELVALLLGSAGLLPSTRMASSRCRSAEDDERLAAMEGTFAGSGLAAQGVTWKLWGVRPQNHPARRIAAAAGLLARLPSPARLLDAAAMAPAEALAGLVVPAWGYWIDHHDAGAAPCRLPPVLLSRSRAIELLVNVILPAAAALGREEPVEALFRTLPRPAAYGRTRGLQDALRGTGGRIAINAQRAQGLLGLNNDWCTHDGCGRCPLI
jgi:hypothetical protein